MISSALPIGPLEPALAAVADAPPVAQDDALAAHETALISGNLFDDHGNGADEDPEGGALRVFEVLERKPTMATTGGDRPSKPARGAVSFEGVSFAYPTREETPVLLLLSTC